jgi:hypothetical protein
MRNIPPEAIRRVEILPEEVALRFGYTPDQRVVNMILKERFSATTVEVEYQQPDRGGSTTNKQEAVLFKVNGPARLNIQGEHSATTLLTEAERGVLQTPVSAPTVSVDPDPAAARSLIPASTDAVVNATWTKGFGAHGLDGSLTLNGTAEQLDSHALAGLNGVVLTSPAGASAFRSFGSPLRRDTHTVTLQTGATLARQLGAWAFTATFDGGHVTSDTHNDRRADASGLITAAAAGSLAITGPLPVLANSGFDVARSVSDSVNSLATLIGRPFHLPAGDLSATLRAGFGYTGISSDDTRSLAGHVALHRKTMSGGFNLGMPITSRRENVLGAVGDLSLNFSAGLDHLSDFGSLLDWSAGLTWGPTAKLNFQASYIVNEQAPDLPSLGNPLAVSLNVPVFDFTRGETALVSVTTGGNRGLKQERDRDIKLGINWQVPGRSRANLIVEYFRNHSDNVTAAFPVLTPAIEAAFAGRVTRDSNGRFLAINRRSITLANQAQSRLRWGFNLDGTLGKASPVQKAMGPRMGRGGGAMGGMGAMMGRGGDGQGRWSLSVYHTVQFTNRVIVSQGGPVLNLLGGDALVGGGTARHSAEMEGGAFYKGFGLRMNGTFTAPTHIRGSGAPGASDLHFGSLSKINLRLFADLGQQQWLAKDSPLFKNARLQLHIDNLFDSRQKVTDQNGAVPISYQADLLDPNGRVIGIELRKQF